MNSTQANKFIMALLGTVFVVMTTGLLADALFYSPAPEKPGYEIVVAEGGASGDAGAAKKEEVSIVTLLQTADPERGAAVFKLCQACHTSEKGGANKIGPHLYDVVNRPAASVADFSYSAAMKEFGAAGNTWDYENLNKFLASPKGLVKGTAMGFAGVKKDNDRASLIAYLRSLSDNPAPLPTADAAPADAPAAEGEEKPAEAAPANAAPADAAPAPAETAPAAPAAPEGEKPAEPAPETQEQAPTQAN
ncbi:c-type cytochrome [Daeguia caeni]|uniref:C-type cytochrome n=1 Tax=Daeguia caeni TaxID=439612 RepID=A0ABV9H827_9HYPH